MTYSLLPSRRVFQEFIVTKKEIVAASMVALFALVACSSTTTTSPAGLASKSSYALWNEWASTSDTMRIMLIEAELASRGQTQSTDGTFYIGRNTGGTVGRPLYGRTAEVTGDRNCSDFASSAAAQKFFLANGGPTVDRHGLDRDGDGNACEWGTTLTSSVARHRQYVAQQAAAQRATVRSYRSSRCYVGPRGGTYTITASGNRNYGGC